MNVYGNLCTTLTMILTLVPSHCLAEMVDAKGTLYLGKDGFRLDQDSEFPLLPDGKVRSLVGCVGACNSHTSCVSVNYRSSDGACMGVGSSIFQFGAKVNEDVNWKNLSPYAKDGVRDGDWTLVFRAQKWVDGSAGGGRLLSTWNNDSLNSDQDHLDLLHPDCYTNTAAGCTNYFRSKWLTNWPAGVQQVRLVLYKAGNVAAQMVFDGTATTRDSWFESKKIISSTWTDLTPPKDHFFSINGQLQQRRIFVASTTSSEDNCTAKMWLVVFNDRSNRCVFDAYCTIQSGLSQPQFLFSRASQGADFTSLRCPGDAADVMAIFIKL